MPFAVKIAPSDTEKRRLITGALMDSTYRCYSSRYVYGVFGAAAGAAVPVVGLVPKSTVGAVSLPGAAS